jgi:hypothetical protein
MLNQVAGPDRVFQALADPGRWLRLERLSQGVSVSELGWVFDNLGKYLASSPGTSGADALLRPPSLTR